jgi:hypothetical protein
MNEVQLRAITEMFIKVMGNQALIMLALSTMAENEKSSTMLFEQATKICKENTEAIDYLRKTAEAQ